MTPMLLLDCGRSFYRQGFVSIGNISLFAGIAVCTATLIGGSGYLIRELHRQVGVATSFAGLSSPVAQPSPSVAITPEMLHVSSIALGRIPLAVVNGTAITEGELLEVQAPDGNAIVRVVSIADGVVRFKYEDQIIASNLREQAGKVGTK